MGIFALSGVNAALSLKDLITSLNALFMRKALPKKAMTINNKTIRMKTITTAVDSPIFSPPLK